MPRGGIYNSATLATRLTGAHPRNLFLALIGVLHRHVRLSVLRALASVLRRTVGGEGCVQCFGQVSSVVFDKLSEASCNVRFCDVDIVASSHSGRAVPH